LFTAADWRVEDNCFSDAESVLQVMKISKCEIIDAKVIVAARVELCDAEVTTEDGSTDSGTQR